MNREEILARSRAEKDDEGMRHAENRAASCSLRVILLITLVVTLYDWHRGQSNHAVYAMLWAHLAADRFSMYRFTKKKGELYFPILAAITSIISLLNYFLGR